jgi:hypothetical protein
MSKVGSHESFGHLSHKLWPKERLAVPTLGILELPFGNLGKKCHLYVSLVERHKVYYKGEGHGFPQVRAVVNLMRPRLPVICPKTKSAPTMH